MEGKKPLFRGLFGGQELSRRSFVKGSTALGAAALLTGCSKNDTDYIVVEDGGNKDESRDEIKHVPVSCRVNCNNACYQTAHVRNGRIVNVSRRDFPDKRYNRMCLRGFAQVQRIYSPTRLEKPLIRDESTPRGPGAIFNAVEWDVAIDHMAKKVKQVYDKYAQVYNDANGVPEPFKRCKAILNFPGSSNYAIVRKGYANLFLNLLRASFVHPRMDFNVGVGYSRVMGREPTYPYLQGNEPADLLNAKTIIEWGGNVTEARSQTWRFIADAITENNAEFVSVDVLFSNTASRATKFVKIKSGMDTLLALSMMHHIMEKGWIDRPYMQKNTVAPFLVDMTGTPDTNPAYGHFIRWNNDPQSYMRLRGLLDMGCDEAGLSATEKALIDLSDFGNDPALVPPHAFIIYDEDAKKFKPTTQKAEGDYMDGKAYILSSVSTCQLENIPDLGSRKVQTAYERLKKHCEPWAADNAGVADKIGCDAEVIKAFADLYANNKPATTLVGLAPDRFTNGHHLYHALGAMAAITGNIGRPGAGSGLFWNSFGLEASHVNPKGNTWDYLLPYPMLPQIFNADDVPDTDQWGNGGPNELFAGKPCPMRGAFILWANVINTFSDPNALIKMFTKRVGNSDRYDNYKMEFLFVSDYEMTDTAEYCDVVLPMSHMFEQEDVNPAGNHPYMVYTYAAVEPYGESKSDGDIFTLLAKRLDELYAEEGNPDWEPLSPHFLPYEEALKNTVSNDNFGMWYKNMTGKDVDFSDLRFDLDRLKREGAVRILPGDNYVYPMHRVEEADGVPDLMIGTKFDNFWACAGSGRLEFYTDQIHNDGYFGQSTYPNWFIDKDFKDNGWDIDLERLPGWEEPFRPPTSEYPFQFLSERSRWRLHSQWFNTPWFREFEPEPQARINPEDAALKGIKTGDLVEVWNDIGSCRARAIVSVALAKGLIGVQRGWHASQFRELYGEKEGGSSQTLSPMEVHPVGNNQAFFDAYCNIRKIEE